MVGRTWSWEVRTDHKMQNKEAIVSSDLAWEARV
jgi:hypothetical protein